MMMRVMLMLRTDKLQFPLATFAAQDLVSKLLSSSSTSLYLAARICTTGRDVLELAQLAAVEAMVTAVVILLVTMSVTDDPT